MLGMCAKCASQTTRYGTNEEMRKPCHCGSSLFWCTIFNVDPTEGRFHYNLVDLETNELLETRDTLPEELNDKTN